MAFQGSTKKKFCSARCRREYQNARRKDERTELRELRKGNNPMDDPWERTGIDEWTDETIWENALLDPMP